MSNGHRPVGAVGFAAAISSPHPPVARRSMNHEAAVADAKIDLLACSSAEGGHEQQQQAGGHLHGHCSGGECLEHSVPLRRMRAMEERTCTGTCLPAPAPGEVASSNSWPMAITGAAAAASARSTLYPFPFALPEYGPHRFYGPTQELDGFRVYFGVPSDAQRTSSAVGTVPLLSIVIC